MYFHPLFASKLEWNDRSGSLAS